MKQQITLDATDLMEIIQTYFSQKHGIVPEGALTVRLFPEGEGALDADTYTITFEARSVAIPAACPLCNRTELATITTSGYAQAAPVVVAPLTVGPQTESPNYTLTSTTADDVDDDVSGMSMADMNTFQAQSAQLMRAKKANEKSFKLMPGESLSPPRIR